MSIKNGETILEGYLNFYGGPHTVFYITIYGALRCQILRLNTCEIGNLGDS